MLPQQPHDTAPYHTIPRHIHLRPRRELQRVAGGNENIFPVRVEPWTLTAYVYPHIQRRMDPARPLELPYGT